MQQELLRLKYKAEPAEEAGPRLRRLYPERERSEKHYRLITFQVTDDCCMACTYCYQHNKAHHSMPFDVAKTFIDKLLNDEYPLINSTNTSGITFDFIGGEPLMEIKLIRQIWEYYLNKLIKLNHPWLFSSGFSICSNGLLFLTPEVQEFVKKYHHWGGISFSIDGNKKLHDTCRLDTAGNGTYDRAVAAMRSYEKISGGIPPTKMTLSPDNVAYTKEAITNLIDLGYTQINFNCVFEEGWTYDHAKILYQQLKELADYVIDNDLYNKIFLSIFMEDYFKPLSEDNNENWCGGVITEYSSIAIDWRGDIFPCLRYMESSLNGRAEPLSFGNVYTGFYSTDKEKAHAKLLTGITRRSQSTDKCFYCPIATGCAQCSAYCYECNGTPNCRTTFICVMHQARALANCYYWNKLYKKLRIPKYKVVHTPKNWALNIINNKEWEELLNG